MSENTHGQQEHAEAGGSEEAETVPQCIWDTRKQMKGLVNTSKDTRGHNSLEDNPELQHMAMGLYGTKEQVTQAVELK